MNPDAYLTRGQASLLTGVSRDAIGKWRARGWISPTAGRRWLRVQRRNDGTLRYRLGDILDAECDTRTSGHSRRGVPRVTEYLAPD